MFSRARVIQEPFRRNINNIKESATTEIPYEENKQEVRWQRFASLDNYSDQSLSEIFKNDTSLDLPKQRTRVLTKKEITLRNK